jgi:hypothetical protein
MSRIFDGEFTEQDFLHEGIRELVENFEIPDILEALADEVEYQAGPEGPLQGAPAADAEVIKLTRELTILREAIGWIVKLREVSV